MKKSIWNTFKRFILYKLASLVIVVLFSLTEESIGIFLYNSVLFNVGLDIILIAIFLAADMILNKLNLISEDIKIIKREVKTIQFKD